MLRYADNNHSHMLPMLSITLMLLMPACYG